MKKSLLAVAVAAALPAAAMAQSNVTLFGILDMAVENVNATGAGAGAGNKSLTRVNQGIQSGSRLGVRGTEDIGGGLKGVFTIEHRLSPDTGDAANPFWFGQSWAGLEGGFGRLTLGRQYTPLFFALGPADFTGYAFYNNWATGATQLTNRINDQIAYRSPTFGGATVWATYAPGETAARNDVMGIALGWQMGGIYAAVGHHAIDNVAAAAPEAITAAALSYKTAGWGVSAGYITIDTVGADSTDRILGSAFVSLAGGALTLNVTQVDAPGADKLNGYGLSYARPLSKRTNWYAAYGSTEIAAGDDNRIALGLRHNF
jgi:predicted porin